MSSRAQRRATQQVERRRRKQRRWLLGGIGILALLVIGGLAYRTLTKDSPGRAVPTLGHKHLASGETRYVLYNSRPPTSGPHLPSMARWGIHTQPIPDGLQVHNLEDGGILVQYNCRNCDALIGKLEAIVSRYSDKVILAPYPNLNTRIALTAWGRIDTFDDIDEQQIVRFIQAYRGIDHHSRR